MWPKSRLTTIEQAQLVTLERRESWQKQKRRNRSTTTTAFKKRTAAIDFYRRIDPRTRLSASQDSLKRAGTSAKRACTRDHTIVSICEKAWWKRGKLNDEISQQPLH
jgi:hypothetical protein